MSSQDSLFADAVANMLQGIRDEFPVKDLDRIWKTLPTGLIKDAKVLDKNSPTKITKEDIVFEGSETATQFQQFLHALTEEERGRLHGRMQTGAQRTV